MKIIAALTPALALATLLQAQGIQSGPEVGMKLTKFGVYAATGPLQGKEFDAAAALGTAPAAILFVKALNRETAPIIRGLDNLTADYSLLGFKSFTVWLTDDRTAGEQRIKTTSNALRMHNPMTLSLDGAEGPGNYAINRSATLTLVMVKDGVVRKCLAFTDTGQKDIPVLRAAIESVAGKMPATREARMKLLPQDAAALKEIVARLWADNQRLKKQLENQRNRSRQRPGRNRNRTMRRERRGNGESEGKMKRGGDRRGGNRDAGNAKKPLPGKHPENDPELMSLLRRSIRMKTTAELDGLFADIDKAVGDDKEKRKGMSQGFVRILGATTYGTDEMRARAKAYCAKAGDKKGAAKAKKRDGVERRPTSRASHPKTAKKDR